MRGHQQDESGAVVPPAPSEADQLAELDPQADQLSGRETAISASLDTLQRQQNARNARKYLELAEPETEKFEKFLGR